MANSRSNPHQNPAGDGTRDTARLLADIASLRKQLSRARLRAANLEAAIRAALSARDDGETDPFAYLRDEITPALDDGGRHGA
jgi:hypothetical protein